jgi:hypothetical protein
MVGGAPSPLDSLASKRPSSRCSSRTRRWPNTYKQTGEATRRRIFDGFAGDSAGRSPRSDQVMLDALFVTIPSSRRWEDLTPDQLWPLEECVGFSISPPEASLMRPLVREAVATCRTEKANRREDLVERARSGRLPPRGVPF